MKGIRATLLTLVGFLLVLGCAGGGGGGGATDGSTDGGRPPVADEPTCSSTSQLPKQTKTGVAQNTVDVIVPDTSIPKPQDAGLRVHTNHLILASSVGRGGQSGISPARLQQAYGVSPTGGSGAIAVVVAYHYPTALNDFNVFSNEFGLPTEPSTNPTASGNQVFRVVYASGSQPPANGGWAQEAALDIQWTHAMAPNAKIYLVEAASAALDDMMDAVNVAKNLPGVRQVSMSFGLPEFGCAYAQYNSRFLRNGVTFFAAAGDIGGDRMFPGLSYNVVTVGGTTLALTLAGDRVSETVWSDTGCGPSEEEPRPVYQDFLYPEVGLYKGGVDIAAVGNPATGVAVYTSYEHEGMSGWMIFGGTSLSAPVVAGCVNNAGAVFASSQALNQRLYSGIGGSSLFDVVTGSAGGFSANFGWDTASGVGSPNGLASLLD